MGLGGWFVICRGVGQSDDVRKRSVVFDQEVVLVCPRAVAGEDEMLLCRHGVHRKRRFGAEGCEVVSRPARLGHGCSLDEQPDRLFEATFPVGAIA